MQGIKVLFDEYGALCYILSGQSSAHWPLNPNTSGCFFIVRSVVHMRLRSLNIVWGYGLRIDL